jgi:hypothetical protein
MWIITVSTRKVVTRPALFQYWTDTLKSNDNTTLYFLAITLSRELKKISKYRTVIWTIKKNTYEPTSPLPFKRRIKKDLINPRRDTILNRHCSTKTIQFKIDTVLCLANLTSFLRVSVQQKIRSIFQDVQSVTPNFQKFSHQTNKYFNIKMSCSGGTLPTVS